MRARALRSAAALLLLGLLGLPAAAGAQERQRLAYSHDERIYTIDAAGAGRSLLVGSAARGGPFSYGEPEWSPDGRALAFTRSRDGRDDTLSQVQVRADGVTRSLTPLVRGTAAASPAFSPDGRTIAFTRYQGTGDNVESQIATMPAAGGRPTVLVRQPAADHLEAVTEPVWMPDGRLAYTLLVYDDESKLRPRIYAVRSDGTDRRLLLRDAYTPSWSPDGSQMAFVSVRDRNGEICGDDLCSYRGELYLARANATGLRRLTRTKGNDAEPAWSGDGSRILFSSDRNFPTRQGEASELYTISPDGRCTTWLTNGSSASDAGDWQPGTGTRADPGGCGAVSRRPLIETRVPRSVSPALWVGRSFGGLLLTQAGPGGRDEPDFYYEDCGHYQPRDCPPPVYLTSTSTCDRGAFRLLRDQPSVRVRHFRGAVLASDSSSEGSAELYTGGIAQTVQVDGERRGVEAAILRGLYRFGRPPSRAGSRLPAPRVSPQRARQLRAAVRVRRRTGSARAAARALGLKTSTVRARLRIARALTPLRTTRCP